MAKFTAMQMDINGCKKRTARGDICKYSLSPPPPVPCTRRPVPPPPWWAFISRLLPCLVTVMVEGMRTMMCILQWLEEDMANLIDVSDVFCMCTELNVLKCCVMYCTGMLCIVLSFTVLQPSIGLLFRIRTEGCSSLLDNEDQSGSLCTTWPCLGWWWSELLPCKCCSTWWWSVKLILGTFLVLENKTKRCHQDLSHGTD